MNSRLFIKHVKVCLHQNKIIMKNVMILSCTEIIKHKYIHSFNTRCSIVAINVFFYFFFTFLLLNNIILFDYCSFTVNACKHNNLESQSFFHIFFFCLLLFFTFKSLYLTTI